MVVAVVLPEQKILGFNPLEETVLALANQFSETTWLIFSAQNKPSVNVYPANILQENLPKNWKNVLIRTLWYKNALPKLIKKYDVSHFWAKDAFLLNNSSVVISVLGDEYLLKGNWLRLKRKISNTKVNILFSEVAFPVYVKEKFGSVGRHIIVPIITAEVDSTDNTATLEAPYFLCYAKDATKADVLRLLKAFSFFKKRMSSTTNLMILTEGRAQTALIDNFQNYKFRKDVCFVEDNAPHNLSALILNCIAFVDYGQNSIQFFSIRLATSIGKAVIAQEQELKRKVFDDTLAFFNSEETLAAQMINMYKDENLRNFYAESSQNFTRQRNVDLHDNSINEHLRERNL